jgi:hypothetical protein
MDDFWSLVEQSRAEVKASAGGRFAEDLATAMGARLDALTLDEILQFDTCFRRAHLRAFQWNLWAVASIMWQGCSDDSFSGFRAGLIGLGREAFDRAVSDADSLAGHPLVQGLARGDVDKYALHMEPLEHVAEKAYSRLSGDDHGYWDALEAGRSEQTEGDYAPGDRFDFADPVELLVRLPRISVLFFGDGPGSL